MKKPKLNVLWDVDDGMIVIEGDFEFPMPSDKVEGFVEMLRGKGIVVSFTDHDQGTTEER